MNAEEKQTKSNKKRMTGTVVSDKMEKTVVVEVQRFIKHPKYKKFIKVKKRYKAHDESGSKNGQKVVIEETRPISKNKHFIVVSSAERAKEN
ncbi:30S ribosomal protein S17 [Candidatus Campbellbacteria bacterium CG11_big_fil_rev_8_21_14_0_20_44_21]|uniref:Small ribosomal subunit protein uS17 n=1 Tax=Candidatus Campbellbacteria bacterium CG22_combo_CG10-13_8_21_14_all_43_18 TaxID=1974530 RepID=A0A2H0DWH1_9BACT|nr:MAG: 30S ribosomal protein S17 [Candidatus Campbellbacteria bacterium CG22_combo_CG10-13_8_21_14_all_43_18]PIR24340.1 MAG: 30S ribosomal protein S17 [Candidatus Campbellbacteria bacterium CG11_big_fil_rev_8_21_14_0_20_44_21]